MRKMNTRIISEHGTKSYGEAPYAKIINTKEQKITYFNGNGRAYWSRHNRIHGGKVGNPHFHTEIGGHSDEFSYIKMLFNLILKSFRR